MSKRQNGEDRDFGDPTDQEKASNEPRQPIPEANFNSQSEDPDEWFGTVKLVAVAG